MAIPLVRLLPKSRLCAQSKKFWIAAPMDTMRSNLRQAATGHMTMLEQTPELAIAFFQDRHVKYAA
jgi:hypothetical protein